MPRVTLHHAVDDASAHRLFDPQDDWMVAELAVSSPSTAVSEFGLGEGPFSWWNRTIERSPTGEVVETIDFRLAAGPFTMPFGLLYRWALRHDRRDRAPFWAPPDRFDARGARAFALLLVATLVAAYVGTLLSQTITYVADEFDVNRTTQGLVTGMTRFGALLALLVVWIADRAGRRRMLLAAGTGSVVFAALAGLSTSIWFFGGVEMVSRGFATGFGLLIAIFAAEETPAGSRAWATSLLALFAGLGSGVVLWLVPFADSGTGRWRALFVFALVLLPVLWALRKRLPESRRFDNMTERRATPAPISAAMRKRFMLLSIVFFATAVFAAPSSNFQNEYLRDERGFSGGQITLFSTVTSTPIGIGVAIFGPMADRRGRRLIGAIGIFGGVVFNVIRFGFGGPLMWIGGTLSTIIGAAAVPALGV